MKNVRIIGLQLVDGMGEATFRLGGQLAPEHSRPLFLQNRLERVDQIDNIWTSHIELSTIRIDQSKIICEFFHIGILLSVQVLGYGLIVHRMLDFFVVAVMFK
jgi:hypothetical protein